MIGNNLLGYNDYRTAAKFFDKKKAYQLGKLYNAGLLHNMKRIPQNPRNMSALFCQVTVKGLMGFTFAVIITSILFAVEYSKVITTRVRLRLKCILQNYLT